MIKNRFLFSLGLAGGVAAGGCASYQDSQYKSAATGVGKANPSGPGGGFVGANTNLTKSGLILGGSGNQVGADSEMSVVGGGQNNVVGPYSRNSVIAGGLFNKLGTNALSSNIGGGYENTTESSLEGVVIAGGFRNAAKAGGNHGTIGGGGYNTVSGFYGTVPGGTRNEAKGDFSFAAGMQAKAAQPGAFVWADNHDLAFSSTATNQFAVRATGGFRLVTAVDDKGAATAGVELPAGSGSWSVLSDREAKQGFAPVDAGRVYEAVSRLPIQSWSYQAQPGQVRHMGPMAQDFHASFGVGENEKTISAVDADGVALAAIQGLGKIVSEQAKMIEQLRREIEALKAGPAATAK